MERYFTAEGVLGICVLLFSIALVSLRRNANARGFEAVDMTILAMGCVYGLAFAVVADPTASVGFAGKRFVDAAVSSGYAYLHSFSALIAITGVYLGWRLAPKGAVRSAEGFYEFTSQNNITKLLLIILVTSIVSTIFYTMDYGGPFGYFDYNLRIRSGIFDFERSRYSFLKPFGGLAIISCIGFWGLLLSRKIRPIVVAGFLVSATMSVYILFADAGRVAAVSFLAIFPISMLITMGIRRSTWIYAFFIAAALGIILLFIVSIVFDIKGADGLNVYITRELSFVFVSFFAQLNEGDHFGFFLELLSAPLYLLPSSLTQQWLVSSVVRNTEIVMGFRKGVQGVTASIPLDVITFGLMQAHLFGVLVYAMVFGSMLKLASGIARSIPIPGVSAAFLAYVFVKVAFVSTFYAAPSQLVLSHFPIIAVLIGTVVLRAFIPRRRPTVVDEPT